MPDAAARAPNAVRVRAAPSSTSTSSPNESGARHGGDDPVAGRGVAGHLDIAAEDLGDLARPGDAEQAHAPARAVLHEEVVADGRDVAADLAEVDRLGVGEPARARRPRAATVRRPGAMKSMPSPDLAGEQRDRAVVGDRRASTIDRFASRPSTSRSPEPSTAHGDERDAQVATVAARSRRRTVRISSVRAEHHAAVGRVARRSAARASAATSGLLRRRLVVGAHGGRGLVERLGVRLRARRRRTRARAGRPR